MVGPADRFSIAYIAARNDDVSVCQPIGTPGSDGWNDLMPQLAHATFAIVLSAAAGVAAVARADEAPPEGEKTLIFGCFPGPDGVLVGGPLRVDASPPAAPAFVQLPFTTLLSSGPV